ncbi:pyridoxal-phosphate dependent enzyme [Streptomyces zagrosensis]|uniref:Diaminopropionate ammonia-lyase n=1 Tax=Streptomyces zagrosensis TaxID=1042984 RepID=A0A7W9UWX9_9ACTN|nr:pyridoxal-phosphate dependent enzyme [Streptomyces zagrosensis]MBB5934395.1 diaminopropionate ammonia-lyase [Streptomyces zagrosensis]
MAGSDVAGSGTAGSGTAGSGATPSRSAAARARPPGAPLWYARPAGRGWSCAPAPADAREFHAALSDYAPTRLVELPSLAAELGVRRVFVKDESSRFGLPAFKALGASWALHRVLAERAAASAADGQGTGRRVAAQSGTGIGGGSETRAGVGIGAAAGEPVTFVTATDGNHGRAVARIARLLGQRAHVFVSQGVHPEAVVAIAAEGARVTRVAGPYDQAVREASETAGAAAVPETAPAAVAAGPAGGDGGANATGGANAAGGVGPDCGMAGAVGVGGGASRSVLVQDSGRPGYERIPGWIVEGYSTLFTEIDAQLSAAGADGPDLVAVPVGVGSLAQAAVTHYRARPVDGAASRNPPAGAAACALLAVEPEAAACVLESLLQGERASIETGHTAMAGLNCGTPSSLAWPLLRDGLDAAVAITEAESARAARDLAALGVSSGPCGAASLAGVRAALTGEGAADRRTALAIGPLATLVLLNTEGAAANPHGPQLGT